MSTPEVIRAALGAAIYVQAIAALVWAAVWFLIDRGRRVLEDRVALLERRTEDLEKHVVEFEEATIRNVGDNERRIRQLADAVHALRLRLDTPDDSRVMLCGGCHLPWQGSTPPESFEEPCPTCGLRYSLQYRDVGAEVPTFARWVCPGCQRAYDLAGRHFHSKCEHCGSTLELVTFGANENWNQCESTKLQR
ncbi:MAG: hypothetical protein WC977_01935 [Anaerovoracaceae bacterium]|jgi:hypothetical protein